MNNSLSTRLTYRIMAVVLAMMAVISGVVYFAVRKYMLDEAKERYLRVLLENRQELRRRLSDVYVAAHNNVYAIERDIDTPDLFLDHLQRIVRQNPQIVSCGLLFEPDYFPSKGRYFVPYAARDTTDVVHVGRIDSLIGDYTSTVWFQEVMSTNQAEWTGAYFERPLLLNSQNQRLLVTFSTPIHNHEGRPVALLCSDMSLDTLRTKMMEDVREVNKKYEKDHSRHSYFFIIDSLGTIVMHPDENRMLKDTLVVEGIVNGEEGEAMVNVNGEQSWVYYRFVKYIDWTMGIVVPKEIILANGNGLNIIILASMLCGLLAIYLFCRDQIRKTTRPLHRFARSAEEIAQGNFSSPLPEVKGNDEVRQLYDAFANMQTSLAEYVDELQETTAQKASLERDLKIASAIQMAMLPKTFPPFPERPDIDLYASLTPAREVGGDLYDYFLRGERLFFCIGDVSGKGVPASLMMMVMRAMFRSEARRADTAAYIVDVMNRNLGEEYTGGEFVTMFVGILDLQTGHLEYCNAGHEPPLRIMADGQSSGILCKPNLPVGALPVWNYEGQETYLQSGDILFLFTDGLSEAMNAEGEQLGRDQVLELVSQHKTDTAQQLVERMENEVKRHAGDAEQSDDITLLAIKCPNLSSHQSSITSSLSIRSSMDDITQLEPFIAQATEQAGMEDKEANRLRLAAEEAVANVINHGEATRIDLQTELVGDQLVLTINDDGKPFDPTQESTTDLSVPPDKRPPGGMGIILLHQMSDNLTYQRIEGHNVLKISKSKN